MSLSKPDKILLRLWKKFSHGKHRNIYINIQTSAFKVLQDYSSWPSRNDAEQMFFLTLKKKNAGWKIYKVKNGFGCITRAYQFSMSR